MLGEGGGFGVKQDRDPRNSGSDLFEYFKPFAGKRILVGGEASSVAAGTRQAPDHASSDRIGKIREHDRNRAGFPQERLNRGRTAGKNHVGLEIDELLCDCSHAIEVARGPAIVGAKVASLDPTKSLKGLPKGHKPSAAFRIGVGIAPAHHGGKQPHTLALLRPCGERPGGRRAAEQRDELAAFHSITSSARASRLSGTVRPSAFAVLRLITNSNFVGCWTGRSAGFSPLRMRPV